MTNPTATPTIPAARTSLPVCAWDGLTDDVLATKYAGTATFLCRPCRLALSHAAFWAIVNTAAK